MTSVLDTLEPTMAFALWGYDLRGSWVLEFAAYISEGNDGYGGEWDRPEWRRGELWHEGKMVPIPYTWALPWVNAYPPSRRRWQATP